MNPLSTKLAIAAALAGSSPLAGMHEPINHDTNAFRKSRKEKARMLTKQRMEELAKCPRPAKRRRRNKK